MASVVFLVHPTRPEAHELTASTERWLRDGGHTCRVLRLGPPGFVTEGEVSQRIEDVDLHGSDLAVSVGGDGTLLRLVPSAARADLPVLGVNFGNLGYLLEVRPEELQAAIGQFVEGRARLEERVLVAATATGPLELRREPDPGAGRDPGGEDNPGGEDHPGGVPVGARRWLALNEVVVERTLPGHTVHLRASVDGIAVQTVRADGLLVATPSGSTAYNLSAGGPVLAPSLRVLVVTPITPHRAVARSLVLEDTRQVSLEVLDGRPAALVVDGQEVGRLAPGSAVRCAVSPSPLRLVTLGRRPIARAIRTVLCPDGPD